MISVLNRENLVTVMKTWGPCVCLWDSTISHLRLAHHKTRLSNESCRWMNYIWSLDLYQFYVLWTSWWYWTFCIAQYSSLLIFSLLQTWGHKGNSIGPKKVSQLLVLGPFLWVHGLNPLILFAGLVVDQDCRWLTQPITHHHFKGKSNSATLGGQKH